MNHWTVDKIKEYFAQLNERFGLSVDTEIEVVKSCNFPLCYRKGKIHFEPIFFNDDSIEEEVRINELLYTYSICYYAKHNDDYLSVLPLCMVKGICNDLGMKHLSRSEIENSLRKARRKVYKGSEKASCFKVGYELREDIWTSYEVTKIENEEDDILVTVKPTGCKLGDPEKVFSEEELCERCCQYDDCDDIKVSMQRNIFMLSGPSGAGKTEVFNQLKMLCSDINRTKSITTKYHASGEQNGSECQFTIDDEFYDFIINKDMVEYTMIDGEYYGTLLSEVEKYPIDAPIFMLVRPSGRRDVLRHFPLAKTIFLQPSVAENENNDKTDNSNCKNFDEASYFDYVVTNDTAEKSARFILDIING